MYSFEPSPENNIYLYHKGDEKLQGNCLDPQFFGKSCLSTREKSQLPYSCIMYVTSLLDFSADSVINQKTGLIYRVEVNPDLIYPFNFDPNNYCQETLPVYLQLEKVHKAAKRDGYIGLVAKWLQTYRVDIWEKVENPIKIDSI
jgi:hypothetical protein